MRALTSPARRASGSGRRARGRDERGSASIWALLLTAGAFTLLLGLIVDGGRVIDARLASSRTAAQAARVGADALSAVEHPQRARPGPRDPGHRPAPRPTCTRHG